jgi:phenylacetate-CoA ligase
MNDPLPTESERYPMLSEEGRRMLQFLREHPSAPMFRNESGNRLSVQDLERVRAFDDEVRAQPAGWPKGEAPVWREDFVQRCLEHVPFYRQYGSEPAAFEDLPTISRADLSRDIAAFVPDDVPIDELINFRTSGTTGHPLLLASHPTVAASYLSYHRQALRRFGIELSHGAGQVSVVLVGYQQKCFTYVSVTPMLGEAGLAKINLHPNDWRNLDDRAAYLDALQPELYTGDPISFAELMKLPLRTRPRALISTSMALLPAFREELEQHFACPVLDLYSMNEAGPVAVRHGEGHVLLQHRMYVEILSEKVTPVAEGERGEVTLTGGFNGWLPLLRYRTGDYASLVHRDGEWHLLGLEGRPPVTFRASDGTMLNNIEVTHRLQRLPLVQWTLHQAKDGALHLRWCGSGVHEDEVRKPLAELFGALPLALERVHSFDGKVVQYTTEA